MFMLRLFAIICLVSGLARAADVPEIKARTSTPVIQELLGGCSLTCSFPWSASDDAKSSAKIAAINDSDLLTAWTQVQVGEKLTFKFPSNLPRDLNGTPFYGVDIANGRQLPEAEFKDYGRVKTIRLFHNGRPLYTIELADSRRWQLAEFDDVFLNVGDTLEIEILDIYPGKKFPTAAITEIVLQGAH